MATFVEHSSTKTRRCGSPGLSAAPAKRLASPRPVRWHPAIFFPTPAQPVAYRPAHRRDRDLRAMAPLPQLAVAFQGGVVVLLELRPQSPPLLLGGEDAPLAPRGGPWREIRA